MKRLIYNIIFLFIVIVLFFVGQLVSALTIENFSIEADGNGYVPCAYRGGDTSSCRADFSIYHGNIYDMDFPFVGYALDQIAYKSNANSNFYIAPEMVQFRVGSYKFDGYEYTDYEFTIVARNMEGKDDLPDGILLDSKFYLDDNLCLTEFPTINGHYGNTVYLHCSSSHEFSAMLKIELDPLSILYKDEKSTTENYITNYVVFGVHGNVNVSPVEMPFPEVTHEEINNEVLNVTVDNFDSYKRYTSNPNELFMIAKFYCIEDSCKDINPSSTSGTDTFKKEMTKQTNTGSTSFPLEWFYPGSYNLDVKVCYSKSTDDYSTSEIDESRCSAVKTISYSTGNYNLPKFSSFKYTQDDKDILIDVNVTMNEDYIKSYLVRYCSKSDGYLCDDMDFHEVDDFHLRLENLNYDSYRFDYKVVLQNDKEYFMNTAYFVVKTPEQIEKEKERNFFEEIIYRFTNFMNDLSNLFISLIIPSNEDLSNFFSHFKNTIEEQFGFLSLPITWILEILSRFYDLKDTGHYIFTWDNIYVPNFEDYAIIKSGSYDLATLLNNTTIKTFHDLYILVSDALIVLSFINYTLNVMNRIFGGDVQDYEITTDSTQITYNERDIPSKVRNTTTISSSHRKKVH